MVLFLLKGFFLLLFFCLFVVFFLVGGGGVCCCFFLLFFHLSKKVPEYKCFKDLHKIEVLIHFQPL